MEVSKIAAHKQVDIFGGSLQVVSAFLLLYTVGTQISFFRSQDMFQFHSVFDFGCEMS